MIYTDVELEFVNKTNTKKKQNFFAKLFNFAKKAKKNNTLPKGLSTSERRDFLAISAKD